jgi:hypothetical protein
MARFFFNLKQLDGIIQDPYGTDLADEATAHTYGDEVARELMCKREACTRAWRLEVCDDDHVALFEIHFCRLDDTLDHLSPELKTSVQDMSGKLGILAESIGDLRTTLRQVRGTLARANNMPWLAAVNGARI